MIFSQIPATQIIDKVKKRLKTLNEQGRIDLDDCIEYIYDGMRDIGVPNIFSDQYCVIDIKEFKGTLPSAGNYCDVYQLISAYSITNVNACQVASSIFNVETNTTRTVTNTDCCTGDQTVKIVTTTEIKQTDGDCSNSVQTPVLTTTNCSINEISSLLRLGRPMAYGGQWMKMLCSENNITNVSSSRDTFIISYREIITSFRTGTVVLFYKAFSFNNEGIPLVPDNIDVEKALEAFLIYRLMEEDFYMKVEGAASVYKEAENNWRLMRESAQAKLLTINLPQAVQNVENQRMKYRRFWLK